MLMRKLVPLFVPSCGLITILQKFLYKDYFKILPIMLNAFGDLLYSKLCWHNRPGPIDGGHFGESNEHACTP